MLEPPADGLVLEGPAWPWGPTVLAAALALPGAAAVARFLGRRRDRCPEALTTGPGKALASTL